MRRQLQARALAFSFVRPAATSTQELIRPIRSGTLWQGALAGMAQPGCAEIGAGRRGLALGDQRGVDGSVDAFGYGGAVVVIQYQNGTSAVAAMRYISAP